MVASSLDKDFIMAEAQFDSLLASDKKLDNRFLITGVETLHELGKQDNIMAIIQDRDPDGLRSLWKSDIYTNSRRI